MQSLIKNIDFSQYANLANQLITGLEFLCIFETSGKVVWTSVEDAYSIDNVYTFKVKDSQMMCMNYMFDVADQVVAGVAVIMQGDSNTTDSSKNIELLTSVIEREIKYTSELNAMSNELAERYEELNLVYESDEAAVDSVNGPDVFEHLIKNCTEYLDVAMTALIMPKEDLMLFDANESDKVLYVHSILMQLKKLAYYWMQENRQSIVSNDLTSDLHLQLFPAIPYKVICSPVYVAGDVLAGILVTLNPSSREDFTNSDRNLLEAMAKKAAKVAMANYDNLTGLYKRETYEIYLEKALQVSCAEAKTHCLLHIDIDGIRVINETINNKAGDLVIVEIAKLIRENTRDSDIAARLMGDKYGVLLDSCSLETGCSIADNIRESIQGMNIIWGDHKIQATACIGVSELNADSDSIQSAIAASELASSIAKENGQNIVQVYRQGDTILQRRQGEVQCVREIQKALKEDMFELFCQPIIPINSTEESIHYEILIRMFDDEGSMVPPDHFIPAAERFRLMTAIDDWVVENTFALLSEYKAIAQEYMWTINLSGITLNNDEFSSRVVRLSERFDISPNLICFEITETAAVSNFDEAKRFINFLRSKGFSFALDDFGTGSSTFAYLKNLPVEYLKVDGSFIKGILNDPFSDAVVKSIRQVSHVQNLKTIAEFVENDKILQRIKEIGIDFAQGYGVGKPASLRNTLVSLAGNNDLAVNI
jgi:diguanylate cyclase (GGDEF)-like protein